MENVLERVFWGIFAVGCFVSIPFLLNSNFLLHNNLFGQWDFYFKGLALLLSAHLVLNWFEKESR